MRAHLVTLAGLGGLLGACSTADLGESLYPPRATSTVGAVRLSAVGPDGPVEAPPKVIVTAFALSPTGAVAQAPMVAYGSTAAPPSPAPALRVELVAGNGRVLSTRDASDPRRVIIENGGYVEAPEALLVVRSPFHRDAQRALLRDAAGATIAEADVAAAIRSFCADVDDEECAGIADPGAAPD